jgi:membrane associated rhomboid family serine protease
MAAEKKKLVMCQACRALVPASEKTCPMCGRESVPARAWLHASTGGHFISIIILTINILLYVLMALVEIRNGGGAEAFMQSASGSVLAGVGALYPGALAAGEWWRLVTWNFLHIGLMHLLFNSFALYQIGPQVEEIYGSPKFIFIYLATGIVAGLASVMLVPSLTAGASGSLFGLIGLMAAYGYRQGGVLGRALMRQMLIWAGIGFVFGLMSPGINNVAHAGGFVAGGGIAFLIPAESPTTAHAARLWNAVLIVCVLVVAASFAMAGRSFNQAQEMAVDGRNVIILSQRIRGAEQARMKSYDESAAKKDPQQAADSLRSAARDVMSVPHIDEQSDQIKQQYTDLLTARAGALETAAKNKTAPLPPAPAEVDSTEAVLNAYLDWEDSVLKKYQLERGRQ